MADIYFSSQQVLSTLEAQPYYTLRASREVGLDVLKVYPKGTTNFTLYSVPTYSVELSINTSGATQYISVTTPNSTVLPPCVLHCRVRYYSTSGLPNQVFPVNQTYNSPPTNSTTRVFIDFFVVDTPFFTEQPCVIDSRVKSSNIYTILYQFINLTFKWVSMRFEEFYKNDLDKFNSTKAKHNIRMTNPLIYTEPELELNETIQTHTMINETSVGIQFRKNTGFNKTSFTFNIKAIGIEEVAYYTQLLKEADFVYFPLWNDIRAVSSATMLTGEIMVDNNDFYFNINDLITFYNLGDSPDNSYGDDSTNFPYDDSLSGNRNVFKIKKVTQSSVTLELNGRIMNRECYNINKLARLRVLKSSQSDIVHNSCVFSIELGESGYDDSVL